MSAQVVQEKRVYIGGFKQTVTEDEIRGRFKPFGEVTSVDLPTIGGTAEGRGFGYVSINITPAQWQRCSSIYSGAKWKGGKLKIEEAKESYMVRMQRERAEAESVVEALPSQIKRKIYIDSGVYRGTMAESMDLVTAKNIGRYEGWTKGRYSRPVLKYSMQKPNGKAFTFDPVKHRNNFEKLFGSVRPKDWKDLQWEYDPELVAQDFELARQVPKDAIEKYEADKERLAKRRRLVEDSVKTQKMVSAESDSDTDSKRDAEPAQDMVDSDLEGLDADEDVSLDMDVFEDAEEVASLVSNAPKAANPELLAKLASGMFDSDSEGEEEEINAASSAITATSSEPSGMSPEEIELVEERRRTAKILGKVLGRSSAAARDTPASAVSFDSDPESESESKAISGATQCGSGKKSGGKKSTSAGANSSSTRSSNDKGGAESNSDTDSDSDSDSYNQDESPSGSGSNGGDGNKDGGSDDSDSSDSTSESDTDSESESDSDSDHEEFEDARTDMMDVDSEEEEKPTASKAGRLFAEAEEGSSNSSDGGLFGGAPGAFRFTDALGLDADEPSALARAADDDEYEAPEAGGARMAGEQMERNLNANRLPLFFGDIDAMTFKRPEPAFQRQKTEEELQADLSANRERLTKEYKAQHHAVVRKAKRMQERQKPKTQG
ncbi:hypothetical protein GGI15_002368 [Coemansia interrupta]|uniref:RRM domain-containing protein n=1 Tax=Coemansia interrupta TaxID=1126814 RepID=A0A9W8HK06_9FUNG|nr:hypothetical protein GGI15_002368 [Coemansia interrupta]